MMSQMSCTVQELRGYNILPPKRDAKREQNQIKKVECEGQNCQKAVSVAVASSCSYGDNIVKPLLLSKDAISKWENVI